MDGVVYGGLGVVGKATAKAFGITHYFDKKGSNIDLQQASRKRYHFFCLPTPTVKGECQRDDIIDLIGQLEDIGHGQHVYIIRSTVIPGTAKYIMDKFVIHCVISNPEFLSEDTADLDARFPDIVVIGGEQKNYIDDVAGIYQGCIKTARVFTTDTITAEMAKYTINAFYATKNIFSNQIFDIAQKIGANYETIKGIMSSRKWVGSGHLEIWDKGGRGAGGHCLQKDLDAFENYSKSELLKTVKKLNDGYLSKFPKKV